MATFQIPFSVIPATFERFGVSRIPAAKVKPLYDVELEPDAIDLWLFGTDAGSLTSVSGQKSTLALNNQAPSEYGAAYVKLRDGVNAPNGLVSTISDLGVYTAWAVIELVIPTGSNRVGIFGNHQQVNSGAGGSGLELNASGLNSIVQNGFFQAQTQSLALGVRAMVAQVVDAPNQRAFSFIGSLGVSAVQAITARTTTTRKFAIGNVYSNTSAAASQLKFFEAGMKNFALTEAQLAALYARVKARGEARGYVVA